MNFIKKFFGINDNPSKPIQVKPNNLCDRKECKCSDRGIVGVTLGWDMLPKISNKKYPGKVMMCERSEKLFYGEYYLSEDGWPRCPVDGKRLPAVYE